MNKADKYYKENLKNILENGNWDENPRPKWKDGTLAHSKFITQVFEKYDISKGEFPIPTLRNTATKIGIKEILAIYQQQENTRESFEKMGVYWWENWMNEEGNIGRSYPYNLESHRPNDMKRSVVKIKPRIVNTIFSEMKNIPMVNDVIIDCEEIYLNRYIVLGESDKTDNEKRKYSIIQFINSGYIKTMRNDCIGKSKGRDIYDRTNYDIGYIGDYGRIKNIDDNHIKILMDKWENMLRRCYSKTYQHKDSYKDIFVHCNWHSFENFLKDVRYLPQYHLAKEDNFNGWELDKDYYGSNCYSSDTCVFLKMGENALYTKKQIKPIKITTDNGAVSYELGYTPLSRTMGLSYSYVYKVVNKGVYKNMTFKFIDDDIYLYRYELSRNQINDLLKGLEVDPYSRRHITSFWNWANIDKKELVECAFETIWSVRKNDGDMYIDMTLIQRSNDYIMAGAINKIQYTALMMMVAGHLGYKVGTFSHLTQNLHVYDRHFGAVDEIMSREPLDTQPTLKISGNKNFYEYTIDDFTIENINGIEKLSSPLEIAI